MSEWQRTTVRDPYTKLTIQCHNLTEYSIIFFGDDFIDPSSFAPIMIPYRRKLTSSRMKTMPSNVKVDDYINDSDYIPYHLQTSVSDTLRTPPTNIRRVTDASARPPMMKLIALANQQNISWSGISYQDLLRIVKW